MAHYPRRRITITGCVLAALGFALLRLPLDQKAYANESANTLRGSGGPGRPNKGIDDNYREKSSNKSNKGPTPKGGMVRLSEVQAERANHEGTRAMKQVLIINGQVPHVTGFSRAVFGPDHEVAEHWHTSMDEVFYVMEGKGIFEIDGTVVQVNAGTTLHVAAGQKHRIKNTGEEDLVMIYLGIAVEPTTEGGNGAGTFRAGMRENKDRRE